MTVLKKDYEAVFKEGFKLGTRLARAKINMMRANDSRMINDVPMMEHYKEYADLGDVELLSHKYDDKPEDEDGYQEVQVGGSGH